MKPEWGFGRDRIWNGFQRRNAKVGEYFTVTTWFLGFFYVQRVVWGPKGGSS